MTFHWLGAMIAQKWEFRKPVRIEILSRFILSDTMVTVAVCTPPFQDRLKLQETVSKLNLSLHTLFPQAFVTELKCLSDALGNQKKNLQQPT